MFKNMHEDFKRYIFYINLVDYGGGSLFRSVHFSLGGRRIPFFITDRYLSDKYV